MWSITLKLMKKNVRMLIPAGIAILIGTAFIAATFLFGNAMDDSLRRQMTAQYGEANAVVTIDRNASDDQQQAAYQKTVADFRLDRLRSVEGVNDARADVIAGVTVTNGDSHASTVAVGTAKETKLLPVNITDGDQPIDNGEIALPESIAKQLGVTVGDTVTITSDAYRSFKGSDNADGETTARVVGLTDDPNGAYSSYGGASVLSDDLVALMNGIAHFDDIGTYTVFLDIAGADNITSLDTAPANVKAAFARVDELLPDGFTTLTRHDIGDRVMEAVADSGVDVTTTFLLSFGVLAMFVAALVIANTFQVLVAQRRRTLALLRTIGAKKGQLYASVLFEAGVLGLIASALGVALGVALMGALCGSGVMEAVGSGMRLILSWQVFAVPILFGIVVTVLASLSSARSATAVTPLEALRPVELTDTRRAGRIRGAISILLILAGLAMAAFAVWQMHESLAGNASTIENDYSMTLLTAIGGAALIFLGVVLSAVFWLPWLMRGVGALVALIGPSANIAHANIQKNPRRVAATGAALLIGVTLVSTIATGAASAKQTMGEALDTRYSVDMIAAGDDMTDDQAKEAEGIKGISNALYAPSTVMSTTDANGTDATVLVMGVDDADALRRVVHADLDGVTIDMNSVLFPQYSAFTGKAFAFDGTTVTLQPVDAADDGSPALNLKASQRDFRRVSGDYDAVAFVDASHFANGDLTASGHVLLMSVDAEAAGTSLNDLLTKVQNVFSSSTDVTVSGPVAERAQWNSIIDSMMALLVGLIAVAVLIALVGVANTLSLSVIERTRESATLRAIGMTKGQLRRSLGVEALLLALVSGVAGVVLGTLFGWLGSYMVFSLYGETVFPLEWGANGIVLAVAAVAALLASVFPARRAVKVPPVEALAEA